MSNLFVADPDHAVYELEFAQPGDLLIAVGGDTNIGLPYYKLGGKSDSYLTDSVLIAKMSLISRFKSKTPHPDPENFVSSRILPD